MGAATTLAQFITPDSDKSARVRANGLINKRIKLGLVVPPASCMKCGAACRPDSHHVDYGQPNMVLWLCRSCHMAAHYDPSSVAHLALIDAGGPVAARKSRLTPAAPAEAIQC